MAKSKIIKDLANSSVNTITALKRAKVLVSALNNAEISKWLDYEISGYPEDATIPSYRKVQGSLIGSYFKGSMARHMTWTNVSLPLGNMPDEIKEMLLRVEFQEGVESLKTLAAKSQASGTEIYKTIPADCFSTIAHFNNDPYMMITSARVVVGEYIISNIFSVIENKLLDMLMILKKNLVVWMNWILIPWPNLKKKSRQLITEFLSWSLTITALLSEMGINSKTQLLLQISAE